LQALVYVDPAVSDVSIEQLTVNGNRFAFSTNWANATFAPGCFPSNDSYIDVNVHAAAGANIHISNVSLVNAPGTSLQHASSLRADHLFVSTARSTGIHMYGSGGSVIRSAVERCGTAGITVHGTNEALRSTTLTNNRREQPDGVPGGQLNLEPESVGATIADVTIDGQNYMITGGSIAVTDALTGQAYACPAFSNSGRFPLGVEGIEGYGARHTLFNVTSRANSSTGMILRAAQNWSVSYTTIDESGITGTGGGLEFLPYLGQDNVVAFHGLTIKNTHDSFGLHLAGMRVGPGGVGGCDGEIVIQNNPTEVEVGPDVDPVYVNTCRAGCGVCQVGSAGGCTQAPNGTFCANGTMTCHNGACAEAFTDVKPGSPYHDFIVDMLRRGVTHGCGFDPATGDRSYCSDAGHTRAEAAVFIVRSRNLAFSDPNHGLPGDAPDSFMCLNSAGAYVDCNDPSVPARFADVPRGHWAFAWIQKLVELGVTHGCSTNAYCPDTPLELYDTTVFVERGAYGCDGSFVCDGAIPFPSAPIYFSDMTNPEDAYFRFIQNAGSVGRWCGKADGSGYPLGRYGVYDAITRRQAAALIERSFFAPE
jgi:hypothetical protein